MIACRLCRVWFHFDCLELSSSKAEELAFYICASCQATTGQRSILRWESIDFPQYEEVLLRLSSSAPARQTSSIISNQAHAFVSSDSSDGEGSEYEYNYRQVKSKMRQLTPSASSDGSSDERLSPGYPSVSKRKSSKRLRVEDQTPNESVSVPSSDPARSYCLVQLKRVLRPIFSNNSIHKEGLVNEGADEYANVLETSLFAHFAEPDRNGRLSVGNRYKTQFRMLTFNLEKRDRETLRGRIAQKKLPAEALSIMTPADLASDQQRKEMEDAHEQSLQHSILDTHGNDRRPLRKITHKGEEEIEDVSRNDNSMWGSQVNGERVVSAIKTSSSVVLGPVSNPLSTSGQEPAASTLSMPLIHGVSDPESPPPTDFNLDSLSWSPSNDNVDTGISEAGGSPLLVASEQTTSTVNPPDDEGGHDHDFNELLALDAKESQPHRLAVWSGEVRLPSMTGALIKVAVDAHLLGGRPLDFNDAAFWQNLFRSPILTIEGRVPIPASESYLLNSRLNSGRELVAVDFVPQTPDSQSSYEELCNGLLAKNRHAVVFPWGNPPRPTAPGKELYLVPLQPSNNPEYLQMLDHMALSVTRTTTILVGIFILHKVPNIADSSPQKVHSTSAHPSAVSHLPTAMNAPTVDFSTLTPEFISELLRTNPAISAAAAAAFSPPPSNQFAPGWLPQGASPAGPENPGPPMPRES
ncbi:hypothetical protein DL93DRAFT_2112272 [Clavulina sp. PMI_390]|nr:hypothetical protein DL93DRAFT_2112272 [Clavulina sp. PMI_390]